MAKTTPAGDDWDFHWRDGAIAASENPAQAYRHALILKELRQSRFDGKGSKLIDFGCGQGDFLAKVERLFPESSLAGFELSKEGVKITTAKVPRAKIVRLNLLQPGASADDFGAWATHATCSEVLEHVDDPAQLIRAMNDYLAPQAWLIITVPAGPMSAFDRHIGHRQHFSEETLRRIIEKNGLKVRQIQRAGFPFQNCYRLIVIARGNRLAEDVREIGVGGGWLARAVMRCFAFLFRWNLSRSPWGWQLIAVAQKN